MGRRTDGLGNGIRPKRARDAWVKPDEITGLEQLKVVAMERWAMSGKMPPRHEFWLLDPQTWEWMSQRMGIWAAGVQMKILKMAMAQDASDKMLMLAGMISKDALNRLLGKPTEKHLHAGHVLVEFQGLDPDRLPKQRPEDATEVVEVEPIDGDAE
jgi:hypothetical protein